MGTRGAGGATPRQLDVPRSADIICKVCLQDLVCPAVCLQDLSDRESYRNSTGVCPDVCLEKPLLRRECARRGGVPSGHGKVAERAVYQQMGGDLDNLPREVTVTPSKAGWTVNLVVALEEWSVEVLRGREIPTIACRSDGGRPAKPKHEYTVSKISSPREIIS